VPQLLNVLRGEMSLVGPRPTSFAASTYDLWHTERLEITPGITGLWQVSGRSDVDFDDRVRLDIEYLERRGFWFDLVILFRTVAALVQQRGAY
jgi:lipopolysaccharide/colanic/teichoic acid biosynthesis glycosyltransferase